MSKRYDPIMCMMVDEPVKAQDAKKEEGFKILSATIRGEKLVLTFEDLLNSPGKKETMEFTKKEAEAFKKDPWNTWTGNTKSIVEKFIGGKVHDSASAIDKAITTADGATGDKLYADVKAIYNLFSNILLTYSNEQSVQKLANEGTKKCLELAAKVKSL